MTGKEKLNKKNAIVLDVVGCGAVVKYYHGPVLSYLQKVGKIRVRGCFDLDELAAAKMAKLLRAKVHGKSVEPFGFEGVDGALIATPPNTHGSLASQYLRAGKHALVEKPFVCSATEAAELVALARQKHVSLLVGQFRRYYPSLVAAKKIISSGMLGGVTEISASEGFRWGWGAASRYMIDNEDGGVIWDTGAHLVDMILFMLSIDEKGAAAVDIQSVWRAPAAEPSHEAIIDLSINGGHGLCTKAKVQLSRLRVLAGVVKLKCDKGTLVVPTSYSNSLLLNNSDLNLSVAQTEQEQVPTDALGCFFMEYYDFIRAAQDPGFNSRIDARLFVGLTSVLEHSIHAEVRFER